jgi:hypothetical protein
VSYWSSQEAIAAWKEHAEHKLAQEAGKRVWYADYQLRVAKVERAYGKGTTTRTAGMLTPASSISPAGLMDGPDSRLRQ